MEQGFNQRAGRQNRYRIFADFEVKKEISANMLRLYNFLVSLSVLRPGPDGVLVEEEK
jgi:hypothetical protein